jgi:hypothetical protein
LAIAKERVMYMKAISIEEYASAPGAYTYLLPRAMAHMRTGDTVRFERTNSGYDVLPTTADNPQFDGVLMADTFPYGVALVAAKATNARIEAVWIVAQDDDIPG